MRIHRLRISAFGPFAGTEEIDFDRLSAHGLFLLNGPTGAGKTSVLDAICFALYGSVPGARQEGKRLRSDHAEPALEPAVTCEFSAQGRHFEVSRSPSWEKPSARGKNGFTTQQAKTLLRERIAGAWTEKSGRNDEAGAEITALLGMDREQFTRVVMLPQGDFAAFLRSKASDRLELLQKLFGTQRFEALEQELSAESQNARNNVARLNAELELLSARAEADASPLGLDHCGVDADEDPAGRIAWLQAEAARNAAELSSAAAAAAAAGRLASDRLETEVARRERRRRLAAAEARKAAAEMAVPTLELHTARLEQHRRAEVLRGQLQAVEASGNQVLHAAGAMESALTLLRMAVEEEPELEQLDLGALDADRPGATTADAGPGVTGSLDIAGELSRLRSLLAVVEARLPDQERLAELTARRRSLVTKQQELSQSERERGDLLESLRSELTGMAAGLQPLEELASAATLHAKEANAAEELLDVVRRYRSAVASRELAAGRHSAAREIQLEKKLRWLDLREERLANAAAELAAHLVEGESCPVCGSEAHPAPAEAAASALGLGQAEEAAQQAHEAAEVTLSTLDKALGEANQLVAVLAGQGGDTPEEEALRAVESARSAARASQTAMTDLAEVRKQLEAKEGRIAAVESETNSAASELARVAAAIAEVSDQLASLDEALSSLRGGHRSLTHRLRSLQDAADTLEKTLTAQAQLDRAEARARDARVQLEDALPEAGFSSAEDALAQLLPETEAAALLADVRAGQDEQARIAELFASEELLLAQQEAQADPAVDEALEVAREAQLKAAADQAAREARDADLAAAIASRSVESLAAILKEYGRLAGTGRGPREHAQLLAALADTAAGRGENTYRMSLNSYVLAARLEQVALAASERLVAMSDGRYLLQHSDAKAARGAKSGLGLEVVDQWTGHRRDTSTLSGGESFMASLSLALGLADVVQQEAGGIQIETLFVDEGFGSLDEQSLEQVMDALEGLRDGGRVVGLVSHVGEMKQRIGTQLQVLKGRNGSTLRISDAAEVLV
ncbi:AAA family ATPase [Pseudarthrobacter sp. YS3]|uniref:AAA family ATPase n=1 Tax=Pseudarthrobacter sp. YS3 TaxID=3453718 RepID=UPI003EE925B0